MLRNCCPRENPPVKYSLPKADTGNRHSERDNVQYSFSNTDVIPATGDKFRKDAVEQLFALYSLNNAGLNKQLDAALNLTFVDMLTRYGAEGNSAFKSIPVENMRNTSRLF